MHVQVTYFTSYIMRGEKRADGLWWGKRLVILGPDKQFQSDFIRGVAIIIIIK